MAEQATPEQEVIKNQAQARATQVEQTKTQPQATEVKQEASKARESTQSAQTEKAGAGTKLIEPKLITCLKARYIGAKPYTLKDTYGYITILNKGDEIIFPRGSLEQHIKSKKTLFEVHK